MEAEQCPSDIVIHLLSDGGLEADLGSRPCSRWWEHR